jgi:glycerophosphoryl diester phosphodiesterase
MPILDVPPRHPYLDWDGPIPFAHRGGASDAPENTMPAFEYAVDLGYRYIETDVQVTSDGVLVAFHDDDLKRTCGRDGRISRLPWSEVRTALVDGRAPVLQVGRRRRGAGRGPAATRCTRPGLRRRLRRPPTTPPPARAR